MTSFSFSMFHLRTKVLKPNQLNKTLFFKTAPHIERLLAQVTVSRCLFCLMLQISNSCGLIPRSVFFSRLCCPKAVWVPVRKRRAKATPIQTSFQEPPQPGLCRGTMSNPKAPKQIMASGIHSVSPYTCTKHMAQVEATLNGIQGNIMCTISNSCLS